MSYQIRRFYRDQNDPHHGEVRRTGLTLQEAQEHCQDDSTHAEIDASGSRAWFDGYDEERSE